MPEASRYHDLDKRLKDKEAEHERLRDALIDAKRTRDDLDFTREQLVSARDELRALDPEREEQERLRFEIQTHRETLVTLAEERREAEEATRAARSQFDAATREAEAARKGVDEATARRGALTHDADALSKEIAIRDATLVGVTESIRQAQERLTGLGQQHDRQLAATDLAREKAGRLESEAREAERRRDAAGESLAAAKESLQQAEEKRAELLTEAGTLEKKVVAAESAVLRLESSLEQLKRWQAEAEKARDRQLAENDRLQAKVDRLGLEAKDAEQKRDQALKELHEAETRKRKVEVELGLLGGGAGTDADPGRELWVPVLREPEDVKPYAASEEQALTAAADHLRRLGLVFPDRVLHALHTSFKVAEESPLTVLAGISGTGKSELPRRYAEAMGMHFLPLAVQPRWDSPQDLFGFYNYLEKRFRPTELSRALLQFDRVGPARGRGWDAIDKDQYEDLSGGILVVLLDEMNLARVEYYFSELLSKLESRRGLDVLDPDARAKSEIALEMGLIAGGSDGKSSTSNGKPERPADPVLRLLVSTNVLFVGTMNEDESTQTLSDKVIDRANLLRFGKPAELSQAAEAPADGVVPDGGQSRLDFDTWQKWRKQPDSLGEELVRVDGWIQRLNQKLDPVGRPFGHRMAGGIRAYAANYPRTGETKLEEAVRLAMADQVEMRVLPRLRGLELHGNPARLLMQDLVALCKEDLGDAPLGDAIAECAKDDRHSFAWSGLDRTREN